VRSRYFGAVPAFDVSLVPELGMLLLVLLGFCELMPLLPELGIVLLLLLGVCELMPLLPELVVPLGMLLVLLLGGGELIALFEPELPVEEEEFVEPLSLALAPCTPAGPGLESCAWFNCAVV
jgi:hypothetical protein